MVPEGNNGLIATITGVEFCAERSLNPTQFRQDRRSMMQTPPPPHADLLACALALADAAGSAIKPYFRQQPQMDDKGGSAGFDPVTIADRAAEHAIIAALETRFPSHGVIGEEFGTRRPQARYQWIIDPIDGTRAFVMGLPTWGTLIGLTDAGLPVLGVMDQPFTGERFWASEAGAFQMSHWGGEQPLRTRTCRDMATAVLSSTHPDLFTGEHQTGVLARLKAQVRMTRYGGDCYAYCLLAAGHIDLIVEPGLQAYDIAALIPIITRAGGVVTTWDGGNAAGGGDIVAAGDRALHARALEIIAGP
jgi:myo-inositol-1(or 4)-monophosphatase